MAAIEWDKVGEREFHTGIDRGVLYEPGGIGVPWNGLTSVDEANNNTVEGVYWDGVKLNDIVTIGEFSGILRAWMYPDEFLECEGTVEDQTGVLVTDQPPKKFHLCYRTKVGNDVDEEAGYLLHLLYNLTANPAPRTYRTLGMSEITPLEFEWNITSVPEEVDGHRPTAHLILDSRKMDEFLLLDIETILYGDDERDPVMPSLKAILTFIRKWDRLIIIDNGDGTWTATTDFPGYIEMLDETTFEITSDTAIFLDADTYEISSSEKNEEDV